MFLQDHPSTTVSIRYSYQGTSHTAEVKVGDPLELPGAVEEITSLTMGLDKIEDIGALAGIISGFHDKKFKLRLLDVSLNGRDIPYENYSSDKDPFEKLQLHTHLTSLNLYKIPLYPSIKKVTTLTEFTLYHSQLLDTPDTILTFLGRNCALERVELTVGIHNFLHHLSGNPQPIDLERLGSILSKDPQSISLEQLRSLHVSGYCQEDIKYLISKVSLKKFTNLKIHSRTEYIESVADMFSPIEATATSPTYMRVDYKNKCVHLSEKNGLGDINIDLISCRGMPSILKKDFLSSFDHIQELHLIGTSLTASQLNPSLFRALKTLTIMEDSEVSITLSRVLSCWESLLDRLEVRNCPLSKKFLRRLRRYAFRHNCDISWDQRWGYANVVKQVASVPQHSHLLEFFGFKSRGGKEKQTR